MSVTGFCRTRSLGGRRLSTRRESAPSVYYVTAKALPILITLHMRQLPRKEARRQGGVAATFEPRDSR
jgi:hypothetical protein